MSITRSLYNKTIRPHLPRKWAVYNGVAVFDGALFDFTSHHPDVKTGLVGAIHEYVEPGEEVVDVAAGLGIAAVHEARAGGTVNTYEGSIERVELAETTVEAANCSDAVEVHHAIVGSPDGTYDHWGDTDDADVIQPSSLPACDVLVLDCEGAEVEILQRIDGTPETAIVESHPSHGAPTSDVKKLLRESGYRVETREYEPGESVKKVVVGRR